MEGTNLARQILDELNKIREIQQQMMNFKEYQHKWNIFVQGQCEATNINKTIEPIIHEPLFAGTSGTKKRRAMTSQRMSRHHQLEK